MTEVRFQSHECFFHIQIFNVAYIFSPDGEWHGSMDLVSRKNVFQSNTTTMVMTLAVAVAKDLL